jgi:beta-glucosidase/6-phospho-beta-glucosidase/beta-galactosidase
LTPGEKAGWVSDSTVGEFEKYSADLAWKYRDDVTNWVVLNEPVNSMLTSYFSIPGTTGFPPAVMRPDLVAEGLRNEAAAYSAAYDIIHDLDPDANVGFALSMFAWRAANPTNPLDVQAAAQFSDFYNRWFPNAVINGQVDANFNGVIDPGETHAELIGKADFFGVNYYGQGTVAGFAGSPSPDMPLLNGFPQFANLLNVLLGGCPGEECSDTPLIIKPSGLRDMIDIADSYHLPLWISENGLADADDDKRASYTVRHLAVVANAINDGIDIRGYISWSLMDNLEWILGYGLKFGLYSFDPVTLERTPRPSLAVFHQITTGNAIPADVFQQYVKAP